MKTEILEFSDSSLIIAAKIIHNGGLVAFPTETVYGLGANAYDVEAVKSIYVAKGRPSDNPLIVHVYNNQMIEQIAYVDERAKKIIQAFMPGSLTIVLPKKECIPMEVTAHLETVAIRMPKSLQARRFIEACQTPIAAPSANTSSRPSPTNAVTVYEDMQGRIPLILKGEDSVVGIESTVLDCAHNKAVILRPGVVTATDIQSKTGVDVCYLPDNADLSKVNSPGLRYKHYAPQCPMLLNIDGDISKVKEKIQQLNLIGKKVVVITENKHLVDFSIENVIDLGKDIETISNRLFSCLRIAEKQADVIIAIFTDTSEKAKGVNNRILKSCGGNLI
ncbi:MAG: L-threonylcarbamoyladenylate synthase [Clostridia bacterium]